MGILRKVNSGHPDVPPALYPGLLLAYAPLKVKETEVSVEVTRSYSVWIDVAVCLWCSRRAGRCGEDCIYLYLVTTQVTADLQVG